MPPQPDYEGFRQFLIQQRLKLGYQNTTQLRHSVGGVQQVTAKTLQNVEDTGHCNMATFLFLPEFYCVGYLELLEHMVPGRKARYSRAADLAASMPWVSQAVEALASASPQARRMVTHGIFVSDGDEREQVESA